MVTCSVQNNVQISLNVIIIVNKGKKKLKSLQFWLYTDSGVAYQISRKSTLSGRFAVFYRSRVIQPRVYLQLLDISKIFCPPAARIMGSLPEPETNMAAKKPSKGREF